MTPPGIDPSGFADPVASKTQWTPLVLGGSSFATHTLVIGDGSRVELVTSSENPDYWSFELNLVLTSGERINVVDHGNLGRVRADAKTISALLGCKLWDAGP